MRLGAGHVDAVDGVAGFVERVDDVARLEGDGLERDGVLAREVVQRVVLRYLIRHCAALMREHKAYELNADERAAHTRVGDGRAVAVQVGVEVQVLEHLRPGLRALLDLDLLESVTED